MHWVRASLAARRVADASRFFHDSSSIPLCFNFSFHFARFILFLHALPVDDAVCWWGAGGEEAGPCELALVGLDRAEVKQLKLESKRVKLAGMPSWGPSRISSCRGRYVNDMI